MEVKTIRLFLSIFLGSITYISISISWNIETPVGGWTSAGFLFLFSSLCGWIFVIYLVLGLNKKKSYLRRRRCLGQTRCIEPPQIPPTE